MTLSELAEELQEKYHDKTEVRIKIIEPIICDAVGLQIIGADEMAKRVPNDNKIKERFIFLAEYLALQLKYPVYSQKSYYSLLNEVKMVKAKNPHKNPFKKS